MTDKDQQATTVASVRTYPSYDQDYAQHLLRLDRVSRQLSEACLEQRYEDATRLNEELSDIQAKLGESLRHYIEWATPRSST